MTRKPVAGNDSQGPAPARLRLLALTAAISLALVGGGAHADPNPFARRGADPAAQAARAAQQQGLQSVQAQQMAQRSLAAFAQAARVRAALDATQVAARAAAAASAVAQQIPDGLAEGGLKIAAGVRIEPGAISVDDPRLNQSKLWLGAKGPTQSNDAGGNVTVTVEQTQKKAILSWESFNVGRRTTVHFDQRAGTQASGANDWIALNRIDDPSGRPSQIFGQIKAEGSVYLLNRNGVVFGGTSQVNTRSLIASSLNLFNNNTAASNRAFIQRGLQQASPDATAFLLTSELGESYANTGAKPARPGDIRIEAGAQVKTAAGGFSLIAAPNVSNAGTVQAKDGQAQLAAVLGASYGADTLLANNLSGNNLTLDYRGYGSGAGVDPAALGYGRLDNSGVIASTRGDVTLVGERIRQDGFVGTTTSISRPGHIAITALNFTQGGGSEGVLSDRVGGTLNFGSGSVTTIAPERDGETTSSARSSEQAFKPPSALLAGAQVRFQENSLVLMPGATLDVVGLALYRGPGAVGGISRIQVDPGATIDLAGLADVQRPISDNIVTIKRVGENELADSPLLRGGGLYRAKLDIDVRDKGVTEDGRAWVGSPLLNAAGYADQVPRTIEQMLIDGGTLNLTGREVVVRGGSSLNLDGGYVHYLGGTIASRRLVGMDGRLYDLADADPNISYRGFAGDYTLDHQRWGVKEQYFSPFSSYGRRYESDYLHGGDAGSLNVKVLAETGFPPLDAGLVLAGNVSARAESGRYQIKNGEPAKGGSLSVANTGGHEFTRWSIGAAAPLDVPADFAVDSKFDSLPQARKDADGLRETQLSAGWIENAGFAQLQLNDPFAVIQVDADAQLRMQPGGRIALTGRQLRVDGTLDAPAGAIELNASGTVYSQRSSELSDIRIGAGARLLARGEWVNDFGALADAQRGGAYINGGRIALSTRQQIASVDGQLRDATGSIQIASGAQLDVSGGGRILADGSLSSRGGRPDGRGGDISLQLYQGAEASLQVNLPAASYAAIGDAGQLRFDAASLIAHNLGGGGKLSLSARDVYIGGKAGANADARDLRLDAGFFAGGEFGAYDLQSQFDAVVAAGAQVPVWQRNYIVDASTLRQARSGSDLFGGGFGAFGRLDDSRRPAANLSIQAGGAVGRAYARPELAQMRDELRLEQGAHLQLDTGAKARLGSRGQVTVLGAVSARAGSIEISGDTGGNGLSPAADPAGYWADDKSVWLGAQSSLDVSGIARLDGLQRPLADGSVPRVGEVLDGGSITLSNNSGYVVVEQGARLNLSGASAQLDLDSGSNRLGTAPFAPTQVWSDAGSLRLGAGAGLYFDGSIQAHGGDAQARGGSVTVQGLRASRTDNSGPNGGRQDLIAREIVLRQQAAPLPASAAPGERIETEATPSGRLYLSAERLQGSGVDTLQLGQINADPFIPVVFEGNVELSLARALTMNASGYAFRALPGAAAQAAPQVHLSAQYVAFNGLIAGAGGTALADPTAPGDASLRVDAGFIDFGGRVRLDNFGLGDFRSRGDIRFYTPSQFRSYSSAGGVRETPGELLTGGDLDFSAAQLYPATGERFMIRALGALDRASGRREATRIRIAGNGAAAPTPLSAGGSLLLDASTIEQGGVLRAPGGSLVLGAANPNDADTLAAFNNVKLTATERVELRAGSLTSVSLDGRIVPYGSTVDGLQWKANALDTDLAAPPQKQVRLDAAALSLAPGANIDLSGGGDLQAAEWVPGTGGSRDVLSTYNTSYASGSAQPSPLYADGREVYAILPGAQSPLAAADPNFSSADGGGMAGKSVYLSGVPGLADGVYTLLPGKYATLPGAFRVVESRSGRDAQAQNNLTAADGTALVSGYYVDALSGAREARSTRFEVQSRQTWGLYSQYQTVGANDYFSKRAAGRNEAVPPLPRDGGQLALSALRSLELGAGLNANAAAGGRAAQVDIAAQAIQIRGQNQPLREGAVQLDVAGLNRLGAASLLIGGVRHARTDGVSIDTRADSVWLDNDAASALRGPEILLAANQSVQVGEGAVLRADGALGGASGQTLLIGEAPAANGSGGRSGEGALLRVSNAGPALVQRRNLPPLAQARGELRIGAGANVDGGASLTLDAARNTLVDSSVSLGGRDIQANSGLIAFVGEGADSGELDGFVIGRATLAQFDRAQRIGLRSYGRMEFHGAVDVEVAQALALSAASFVGDGSQVSLRADALSLSNDLGTRIASESAGAGALNLSGREVVFAGGEATVAGFGQVRAQASEAISVRGKGSFDVGGASLSLQAPVIQAEAGADGALRSGAELRVLRGPGNAPQARPQGGALTLSGASIEGDGLLRANSGRIVLRAERGDVRLGNGALVDVSGLDKTLFDQRILAPAGRIELAATQGSVNLAEGAVLDFSAPAGGDAGRLRVDAAQGAIELAGALRGGTPKGVGGSVELDAGRALDLDALAQRLNAGGIDQRVAVRTRGGELHLSEGNTLRARQVSLIADGERDGAVRIDGRIDASGVSGGQIELWARRELSVDGQLLARGSDSKRRGGDISLGVGAQGNGRLHDTHGYQLVDRADSGALSIGAKALLDVSGGSAGGLSGGRIDLRAPLLSDGDVRVDIADPRSLVGAREVGLEAYAVWSTDDASASPDQHFDGLIDPAGWFQSNGEMVSGKWQDFTGAELRPPTREQLADYLNRHYFTPDAGQSNAAHQRFYGYRTDEAGAQSPGTLMGFVQNPGFAFGGRFDGIAKFRARPGIELRNPGGEGDGSIQVLTNWNLNSGQLGQLDFRYNGAAPVLSLRAKGDIVVKASLSDGFARFIGSGQPLSGDYAGSSLRYGAVSAEYTERYGPEYSLGRYLGVPEQIGSGDAEQIAQYYGQYDELVKLLTANDAELEALWGSPLSLLDALKIMADYAGEVPQASPTPANTPVEYGKLREDGKPTEGSYLERYRSHVVQMFASGDSSVLIDDSQKPLLPMLGALIPLPPPADRSPSLQAQRDGDRIPFASRTLTAGDSSSWRLIAGADLASAAPNALRAQAAAGNIVFDGHTTVTSIDGLGNLRTLPVPNVLRTGTGSIELAAAQDIRFADQAAPASVYTAGTPAAGTTASSSWQIIATDRGSQVLPDLIQTGPVNPEAAGNLLLRAGRDIVGEREIYDDAAGTRSGKPGTYLGQYWWPWMQTGNVRDDRTVQSSSINFGGFAQGLLSVGGNVSIQAGRDITELSVSLPTTWVSDGQGGTRSFGGGDLRVDAGRDVLGGDFFVAKGEGSLSAGGRIGSAFQLNARAARFAETLELSTPVAPVLAMQDAQWRVVGAQDVEIGQVLNPSYLRTDLIGPSDSQRYGDNASLQAMSVAGDLSFGSVSFSEALYSYGLSRNLFRANAPYEVGLTPVFARVLPGRVSLSAPNGDLSLQSGEQLFPSASGQLSLLAGGDLALFSPVFSTVNQQWRMLDFDPSWMPSPVNQLTRLPGEGMGTIDFGPNANLQFRVGRTQLGNLHRDDAEPVRIYAGRDIVGGLQIDGVSLNALGVEVAKPATILAGRDIVDLNFRGQNFRASDTTRIAAGRDLFNRPLKTRYNSGPLQNAAAWMELGGQGTFEVQAGRDLGRLTSANEAYEILNRNNPDAGGIRTIGNRNNAGLAFEGADLVLRFGVGPGLATADFAGRYLDPANAEAAPYRDWLVQFMARIDADQRDRQGSAAAPASAADAQQAWQAFQAQPQNVRQLLVDRVFLDVLKRAGRDTQDRNSPNFGKYVDGYRAINTLFPAQLGYTANQLEGGSNGADKPVATGRLDMRGSTVQTERGGDIRILGPGGDVLVGSVGAPPTVIDSGGTVRVGPNQQGILTLDVGDIGIFTDGSVLLAQSRVFTQGGGDLTIWSSNGDINAGKGAKTSSDKPPVRYFCDDDHNCRIDARGLVSGAGIATLQTAPGAKPGDAVLVAPRGTIDAGDAGIRIAGNLIVAAQSVANADNIQVDGDSLGIPVARGVDTGALSAASNASSGVNAAAEAMAEKRPAASLRETPAIISVQVIGFGRCTLGDTSCMNVPPP
ncbi:filamentous haemagglutinin family protein [Pseudomonas sp. CGJS7]|uniref:filamentous haemagglutinin family protein n=1 Tax=Pseudomonas sp. CGJS7 TaxID=3109348 RepID=UPI003009EDBA